MFFHLLGGWWCRFTPTFMFHLFTKFTDPHRIWAWLWICIAHFPWDIVATTAASIRSWDKDWLLPAPLCGLTLVPVVELHTRKPSIRLLGNIIFVPLLCKKRCDPILFDDAVGKLSCHVFRCVSCCVFLPSSQKSAMIRA